MLAQDKFRFSEAIPMFNSDEILYANFEHFNTKNIPYSVLPGFWSDHNRLNPIFKEWKHKPAQTHALIFETQTT